ncbi:hypothetical protein CEXT_455121 [Caerostris extrusa]|uniref:Uncharacterized protein n=1 Tax=Caerostris extrusa TaxID=172846 RepID=A0AAV4QHN7_CAEEX|nr:hypothetical protein CEXT_455121 [Caerostris extrusa]
MKKEKKSRIWILWEGSIQKSRNIIPRGLTKEQKGEKGKKKNCDFWILREETGRPSSLLTQIRNTSDQSHKNGRLTIRHTAPESAPGKRLDGRFRPQQQMSRNIIPRGLTKDQKGEKGKKKKKSQFLDTERGNPSRPSSLLTQSRNPSDQWRKNGRLTIHQSAPECTGQ